MIKNIIDKFLNKKNGNDNFVAEINKLEPELEKLTNEKLKEKSGELKKIIQ